MEIGTDLYRMEGGVDVDSSGRNTKRAAIILGSKIRVGIFGLEAEILSHGKFNTSASCPTDMRGREAPPKRSR